MHNIKDIIGKTIIEEFIKEIIKSITPSGILVVIFAHATKMNQLDIIAMFGFSVVVISIYVFITKQKDSEILNSYKVLNNPNNFNVSYGEKWLLDILLEKERSTFLRTENFANLINENVEYIEKHYDPDPEVWDMIYSTQKKFADKNYVDAVIDNLITYGFIEEKNEKGLLKINSSIFNYKQREKILYEKNKNKEKSQRYKLRQKKEKKKKFALIKARINNMFSKNIELSSLAKTWILDIDGTLVKHNGYKIDGYDTLLDGVKDFFAQLSFDDKVILLTARKEELLPALKEFLKENNIHYDYLLTDMPMGERILVNDRKPSGLDMAFAINKDRDKNLNIAYKINEEL